MGEITLKDVFGDGGLLAKAVSNYAPRDGQLDFAERVLKAVGEASSLIVEAGTGTGKTYAYLIPAILSGKKTIVSTGTKTLQDQLFYKDTRLLKKLLKPNLSVAMLKGRANYICLHQLHVDEENVQLQSKTLAHEFSLIKEQLPQVTYGEINEFSDISEDSLIWREVTSTNDSCLGRECEFYEKCYLTKARKRALESDLTIINHHLFFADGQLKDEGFAEILPNAEVVIFDEAHQLVEVGSHFFGGRLSSRAISLLCYQLYNEIKSLAKDDKQLVERVDSVLDAKDKLLFQFEQPNARLAWVEFKHKETLTEAFEVFYQAMCELQAYLAEVKVRSKVFVLVYERLTTHLATLKQFCSEKQGYAYWAEVYKKSFVFNITPLAIQDEFSSVLQDDCSYIYTSATLSVGKKTDFFQQALGLSAVSTLLLESPFDYLKQALFYMPRGLPKPNVKGYTEKLVGELLPIIEHLVGRTFLLFTSFKALMEAKAYLIEHSELPLLVQGEKPKLELIDIFKQRPESILLGTQSFWEGVDVKGQALSCVVIDKLPFESPSCPVLRAKCEAIRRLGGHPFNDHQLPHAVINLKQGIGRLIRDIDDQGLMVVADPRLSEKSYGELFFASLPLLNKTRDRQSVLEFIDEFASQ